MRALDPLALSHHLRLVSQGQQVEFDASVRVRVHAWLVAGPLRIDEWGYALDSHRQPYSCMCKASASSNHVGSDT